MNGSRFQVSDELYQLNALVEYLDSGVWGICTGTLIDPSWVVTAAHCKGDRYRVSTYVGSRLDASSQRSGRAVALTERVVTVEDMQSSNYQEALSDVMLVELEAPLALNEASRVSLISGVEPQPQLDGVLAVGAGAHDEAVNIGNELRWKALDGLDFNAGLNLISARGRPTNKGDSGGGLFRLNREGAFELIAVLSGSAEYKSRWTYLPTFRPVIEQRLAEAHRQAGGLARRRSGDPLHR